MAKKRSLPPVTLDDMARVRVAQAARLSPDGAQVVYALVETDGASQDEFLSLWLLTLATGQCRRLSDSTARDSNPAWSPDGSGIAFVSNREGKSQLWLLRLADGELRRLTHLEQGVADGPQWSPDGRWLAFTARARPPRDAAQPYRITRHTPRFDGMGWLDEAVEAIWVADAATGEARCLTPNGCHNGGPLWSPDGGTLLHTIAHRPDTFRSYGELATVTLAGETRLLVGVWGNVEAAVWLPDGERIAFIGRPADTLPGTKNDVWVIGRDGGEPECRTPSLAVGVGGFLQPDMPGTLLRSPKLVPTGDGRAAWVQVQAGGTTQTFRVALDGPEVWEPVLAGDRSVVPLDAAGDRLLVATSTLHDPFALALWADRREQPLTDLNPWLRERARPSVEPLRARSADSVAVEGWLLRPPTGEPPFPTVLYIHGGPHQGYGHIWEFDFQLLAGAGFAVLFANQRGSTGYGDGFATGALGAWGGPDYDDLRAIVEVAVGRGLADPRRLGCAGMSGGGFMACWMVGQSDHFRAAVAENPVTNWVSFYGVSDIGPRFAVEEMGGLPHEIPDVYRRCSPITYAHRCTTPTLLVQCDEDHRCPPEQAEQFYRVLKASGCPAEMVRLPGAAHLGAIRGAPRNRHAQNEAMLEWMVRWLV